VNAICFSRAEQGRWLASGGDDKKVILWDLFSDFDQITPVASFDGPAANIFSTDFSADGRRLVA
jgi:WD repeat-containing protein 22